MLNRLKARLLKNPTGVFARFYLGPMWNRRNVALNDAALAAVRQQPGGRLLEIGFGGGYLLERLAETGAFPTIRGVDASPTLVDFAARRLGHRLDLRVASAVSLPFAEASFDVVVSVNSMFYWPDAARGLAEIRRVLTPGGLLVLCLTEKESLLAQGFARYGVRAFDEDELGELLEAAGFGGVGIERRSDSFRRFLRVVATAQ